MWPSLQKKHRELNCQPIVKRARGCIDQGFPRGHVPDYGESADDVIAGTKFIDLRAYLAHDANEFVTLYTSKSCVSRQLQFSQVKRNSTPLCSREPRFDYRGRHAARYGREISTGSCDAMSRMLEYLPHTAALWTLTTASVASRRMGRGLVSTATLYGPRKTAACML